MADVLSAGMGRCFEMGWGFVGRGRDMLTLAVTASLWR